MKSRLKKQKQKNELQQTISSEAPALLSPQEVIFKLTELKKIPPKDGGWGYLSRVLSNEGKVHEFVDTYKQSAAWSELKSKAQRDMNSRELIVFAMMTDDIKLVNEELLDLVNEELLDLVNEELLDNLWVDDEALSRSLRCMTATIRYMKSKSSDQLKVLNHLLTERASFASPVPVYMNLAGADFQHTELQNQGFPYANLTNVNFKNATVDVYGGAFNHSRVRNANFENAFLLNAGSVCADFTGSNCKYLKTDNTSFVNSDFTKVNFTDAKLELHQLSHCIFKEADLQKAVISAYEGGNFLDFTAANLLDTQINAFITKPTFAKAVFITEWECGYFPDFKKALNRIRRQISLLEERSNEHSQIADRFESENYLQAVIDSMVAAVSDTKMSVNQIRTMFDYAMDHPLFADKNNEFMLPKATNYALRMFDKTIGCEANAHRAYCTPMQLKLYEAKMQLITMKQPQLEGAAREQAHNTLTNG